MAKYASVLDRAIALSIDTIIATLLALLLAVPIFGLNVLSFMMTEAYDVAAMLGAMGTGAAVFVFVFLYFMLLEGYRGQTLGKMVMRIRVTREDGKPIGYVDALVRNLLRAIDSMPAMYILGLILVIVTEKKQRLGDMLARTIVVRE